MDADRKQMVKLRVIEELAGNSFIAYDNGNPIEISLARKNDKIKANSGKKKPVLKELYSKYIGGKLKQETVVLADELIEASNYKNTERPTILTIGLTITARIIGKSVPYICKTKMEPFGERHCKLRMPQTAEKSCMISTK